MSIRAVAVVVPARNEAWSVAACLRSVVRALPNDMPSVVVLVDDGSTDQTAAYARPVLAEVGGKIWQTFGGSAGAARRIGVERAFRHFDFVGEGRVGIASTDEDSIVPATLMERQLDHAARGADAVAGLVRPIGLSRAVEAAFDERYVAKIDGDRHGHIHGANMGVRGSAYARAGGFRAVSCHEDRLLWERLVSNGSRVVADSSLLVATSGRSRGRAVGGFAPHKHRAGFSGCGGRGRRQRPDPKHTRYRANDRPGAAGSTFAAATARPHIDLMCPQLIKSQWSKPAISWNRLTTAAWGPCWRLGPVASYFMHQGTGRSGFQKYSSAPSTIGGFGCMWTAGHWRSTGRHVLARRTLGHSLPGDSRSRSPVEPCWRRSQRSCGRRFEDAASREVRGRRPHRSTAGGLPLSATATAGSDRQPVMFWMVTG